MPIISLQQNITSLREGMNQIGTIRKGAPKKPNAPGEDLPHFRIILNEQYKHLQPVIDESFGEKPEWFAGAHVLEDSAEKAFSFWLEEWGTATLYHRCDGEYQHQWYDGKQYQFARTGMPKLACEAPACNCARVGRLALWFESILIATGEFGYFTVYTSSKNDIAQVQKQLMAAEYLAAMAGKSLASVPFIFGRYDKAISSPAFKKEGGKWVATDKRTLVVKSLFELRIDPRWNQQTLLPAIREAAVLPPPAEEKPATELRIADATRARALLGSGGPRRIDTGIGASPVQTATPATVITPPSPFGEMEMTPPAMDDDEPEMPADTTPAPEAESTVPDDTGAVTFVSSRIKYIGVKESAYVLFAGADQGDEPARLYGRDMLRNLGPEFAAFADGLKTGPATQKPIDLPESLTVTATEKVNGEYSYWLVTKLERADQRSTSEHQAVAS